jgi:hypothetical protein
MDMADTQVEDYQEDNWWTEDSREPKKDYSHLDGKYCPACMEEVVLNTGSEECEYAIVEEFPELVLPTPSMQSKWSKDEFTPKKILINELAKVGMVIQQFRIITVYPHLPPESGIPIENCYDSGFGRMLSEIQNKKGVIILGGNLCKKFTGWELKHVQGLSEVHSDYLPDIDRNIPRVFLSTIRTLYSVGSGEMSLGLKRFAKQLEYQYEKHTGNLGSSSYPQEIEIGSPEHEKYLRDLRQ